MIDWRKAQAELGVKVDGDFGPVSYTALLSAVSGHRVASALGAGLAVSAAAFGVDATPDRLAGFIGQACHESAGFQKLQEDGSIAYFTRLYEGRADLGNTQPGDGARFHGRGLIQLTGRANYRVYGGLLGFDFLAQPDLVATPTLAVMTALQFWQKTGLNAYADRQDWTGMTRRINGGTTGLAERVRLIEAARGLLV